MIPSSIPGRAVRAGRRPERDGGHGTPLACHAYSAANWLAMHCRRHMHVYGTTREQLGWLAINSRRNAGRNPLAAYRSPITMEDYLASRPVSTPFGLFDCDVPVDGSIAIVVSAAAYAGDCPNTPVRVEAIGCAPGRGGWVDRPDYPKMASIEAAAQMWSRTDLGPKDVDIAELYDGFTFLTFADDEVQGFGYAHARAQGFAAADWRLSRRFSAIVETTVASRLVTNVERYPGLVWYLALGARLDLDSGLSIEGGFTENIADQQATSDISFQLALVRR